MSIAGTNNETTSRQATFDPNATYVDATAEVSDLALLGAGTQVWTCAQVREGAKLGEQCVVGKGAYIDFAVEIGDKCKIQNNCCVYHGVTLEDGVFLGPAVILTNDRLPRAVNPDMSLKSPGDWSVGNTLIKKGASIGAGSVVLPDLTIGRFAMIGAGSVVTKSVPDHAVVCGNPARLHGYVCRCGRLMKEGDLEHRNQLEMWCSHCEKATIIAAPEPASNCRGEFRRSV